MYNYVYIYTKKEPDNHVNNLYVEDFVNDFTHILTYITYFLQFFIFDYVKITLVYVRLCADNNV